MILGLFGAHIAMRTFASRQKPISNVSSPLAVQSPEVIAVIEPESSENASEEIIAVVEPAPSIAIEEKVEQSAPSEPALAATVEPAPSVAIEEKVEQSAPSEPVLAATSAPATQELAAAARNEETNSVPTEPAIAAAPTTVTVVPLSYIHCGGCKMGFPQAPKSTQQTIDLPQNGGQLVYEVHQAPQEDGSYCLLLVASYPNPVMKGQELKGIEGLLRGIVEHNPDNHVAFAHLVSLADRPAVDFLIESTSSYFRGVALMVGHKLYLIAVEGRKGTLNEQAFEKFVKTFSLEAIN